jgi:hypothetical protein
MMVASVPFGFLTPFDCSNQGDRLVACVQRGVVANFRHALVIGRDVALREGSNGCEGE